MKDYHYFATSNSSKVLSFHSLKNTPGIYMITNKTNKKFYIGMSTNLKGRFYNYLDENSLNRNKSTRISKALLKYGFDKFSISILEFPTEIKGTYVKSLSSHLREREDFFIRVFKPQYNIKRSTFNMDIYEGENHKVNIKVDIPTKIKNLLDNCLDPALLDWNIVKFSSNKNFYSFVAITPKCAIKANSAGWFQGNIQNTIGFERHKIKSISIETIINCYTLIDKAKLAHFYLDKKPGFVKERLNLKSKALKLKVQLSKL